MGNNNFTQDIYDWGFRIHRLGLDASVTEVENKMVYVSEDCDAIWQCSNCGHIVIGPSAPEICPVCDHPQSYFQVLAQNYSWWACWLPTD